MASPQVSGEAAAEDQDIRVEERPARLEGRQIVTPQPERETGDFKPGFRTPTQSRIPGERKEDGHQGSIYETSREDGIAAVREVFSPPATAEGLERETAVREVAKVMGFDRLGPRIREFIEGDLVAAVHRGVITTDQGTLRLDCRTIQDYPRELLKKYLFSVMGTTWWDQDEAIRATARYLGFRRTGSAIEEALKSAISGAIRQRRLERDGAVIRRTPE